MLSGLDSSIITIPVLTRPILYSGLGLYDFRMLFISTNTGRVYSMLKRVNARASSLALERCPSFAKLLKRGLLPGLTFSNELFLEIRVSTAILLVFYTVCCTSNYSRKKLITLFTKLLKLRHSLFVKLPCALIGMNSTLMSQYIKFVADRLLVSLVCKRKYNVENPFDWMEFISTEALSSDFINSENETKQPVTSGNTPATNFDSHFWTPPLPATTSVHPPPAATTSNNSPNIGKANFFERRVGDYQKASVMSNLQDGGKNFIFKLDEDF
ncbi:hypothetical protein HYC85_013225 [Camellia sinensis]|uniref:Uncharacterized protein n=1 Tax=Camellia sinensis TaxID=4442 RepID=A0A7J7H6D6_CAMSI|nr:hypothetical protein HYC85_013225 [Camellia sinensis]